MSPIKTGNLVFITIFLTLTIFLYAVYSTTEKLIRNEIHNTVLNTAGVLSTLINIDKHNALNQENFNVKTYNYMSAILLKGLQSNEEIDSIYTVRLNKSNNVEFVLLPKNYLNSNSNPSEPFVRYVQPNEFVLQALYENRSVVGPYTDNWGSFISAYVPMQSTDGKISALGVDFPYANYEKKMEPINDVISFSFIVSFAISLLLGGFVTITQDLIASVDSNRRQSAEKLQKAFGTYVKNKR